MHNNEKREYTEKHLQHHMREAGETWLKLKIADEKQIIERLEAINPNAIRNRALENHRLKLEALENELRSLIDDSTD